MEGQVNGVSSGGFYIRPVGTTLAIGSLLALSLKYAADYLPSTLSLSTTWMPSSKILVFSGLAGGVVAMAGSPVKRSGPTQKVDLREDGYPYSNWHASFEHRRSHRSGEATYEPGNPLLFDEKQLPSGVAHNPKEWLEHFNKACVEGNGLERAHLRRQIFWQTLDACNGFYLDSRAQLVERPLGSLTQGGRTAVYYAGRYQPKAEFAHWYKKAEAPEGAGRRYSTTVYKVEEGDIVQVGRALSTSNPTKRVAIANAMNMDDRGGNPAGAAGALEEHLCRSGGLYFALDAIPKYPLPPAHAVYTRDVPFFRESEKDGYAFCAPFNLDVVGFAAPEVRAGHLIRP